MNKVQPNFLDDIEKFYGKSLNKKNDLTIILEAVNTDEKYKDFENLSFTGKYVNGLFRVLQNSVKIPEVENVDQIKELVGAAKYRPLKGEKLESLLTGKSFPSKELKSYLDNNCEGILCIANIESIPAVERLDDLLSVEGLDAVFIGPHDLSINMGIPEQYDHPDFISTVKNIISKAPSAELKPDQKDADSLPPYELLDPVLTAYVEEDQSINQIVNSGTDEELVKRVAKLVDTSEYKRRQAPPGVKTTPKAFGRDRRLPITNRFKGW